jgi:short-subunit dehydrogenase
MRIRDRVVLITGASEGIGAACAAAFRDRGARLCLTARSADKLAAVAQAGDLVIPGDLLDPAHRRDVVDRTVAHFGRVDILINNAGVGVYEPAHQMSMDLARSMFELNFFAPLHLIQYAVREMKPRREGAIVNVGSIAGKMTLPWFTLYSASKYALNSLGDGLRMELDEHGIHVMNVCPGFVRTRFQENVLSGVPPPLEGLRAFWALTPSQVAERIVEGLERDARTVLAPRSGWLLVAAARLFPGIVDSQLAGMYRKLGMER